MGINPEFITSIFKTEILKLKKKIYPTSKTLIFLADKGPLTDMSAKNVSVFLDGSSTEEYNFFVESSLVN